MNFMKIWRYTRGTFCKQSNIEDPWATCMNLDLKDVLLNGLFRNSRYTDSERSAILSQPQYLKHEANSISTRYN